MPKIQAEDKTKLLPFTVKIREDVQEKIVAYGHYLDPENPSRAGHVVTECFKQVCERDADFASFLKSFTPQVDAKSDARKGKAKATKSTV